MCCRCEEARLTANDWQTLSLHLCDLNGFLDREITVKDSNQGCHDNLKWKNEHLNRRARRSTGNLLQPKGHHQFFAKYHCCEERISSADREVSFAGVPPSQTAAVKSRDVGNSSILVLFGATKGRRETESSFPPRILHLPQSPPSYEAMHLTFSGPL
jgi:hypothetical protein